MQNKKICLLSIIGIGLLLTVCTLLNTKSSNGENNSSSLRQIDIPIIIPSGGKYTTAQNVTISTTTNVTTIGYTTDGSTPTSTNGTIYST